MKSDDLHEVNVETLPCPETKIVDGSDILVIWYENGQKRLEAHYKNGEPDGLQTYSDEDGRKTIKLIDKDD